MYIDTGIESRLLRRIVKLLAPVSWAIPSLMLGAGITVVILGHHLASIPHQEDPECDPKITDCVTHAMFSSWTAWTAPIGIALLLLCLAGLVIAFYDLPGYVLYAPIGIPLAMYLYRHDIVFGRDRFNRFIENAAWPAWKFGTGIAGWVFVGGFLVDIGISVATYGL